MSNTSTVVPDAGFIARAETAKAVTLSKADPPRIPSLWPPEKARDEKYTYLIENFVWNGTIGEARDLLPGKLLVEKLADGWERLFLATALTGNPKKYAQVWKVPRNAVARQVPASLFDDYEQFFDKISEYERIELEALAHDPHHAPNVLPEAPSTASTMMIVRANIRDGAMATVEYWKNEFFVPLVTQELGWKLHFAGYVTSQSLPGSTLIQAWELPDETSLGKAMIKMAHQSIYVREIANCIQREDQNFYSVVQSTD